MRHTATRNLSVEAPDGCWLIDDGVEVRVGASSGSRKQALGFFVAFLVFGMVLGTLLTLALNTMFHQQGGVRPGWMPFPNFRSTTISSVGMMKLWFWVAVVALIESVVVMNLVMRIGGRVEVILRAEQGRIVSGFGPIGVPRNFDITRVKHVRIRLKPNALGIENGPQLGEVVIEADRTIRFGLFLNATQQSFIQRALSEVLGLRDEGQRA